MGGGWPHGGSGQLGLRRSRLLGIPGHVHRGAGRVTAVTTTITTGAPNGVSRQAAFDRWLRYPAGFSQETLDQCLDALPHKDGLIIDPFAGVGTTGTHAIQHGYSFRGIETHPLVAEIAGLKFTRLSAKVAGELKTEARKISSLAKKADTDVSAETSLVQRSFDPSALRVLIAIREAIKAADTRLRPYLRCALIGSLRDVASVKVGWPYQRPAVSKKPSHRSVSKRFLARVEWLVEDLELLPTAADAGITLGDSRRSNTWRRALNKVQARACVSSPPYLNNFDYADATRLELYFLGNVRTWADLCSQVRVGMIAATTQQSTQNRAKSAWTFLGRVPHTKAIALDLAEKLTEQRKQRPRGKEYDQTLPAYLADVTRVLGQAYLNLLKRGALAWVIGDSAPYGVYIDTPALVAQIAVEIGFTPVKDVVLRARGHRWATNGTRHQVPLSERLIVLER